MFEGRYFDVHCTGLSTKDETQETTLRISSNFTLTLSWFHVT